MIFLRADFEIVKSCQRVSIMSGAPIVLPGMADESEPINSNCGVTQENPLAISERNSDSARSPPYDGTQALIHAGPIASSLPHRDSVIDEADDSIKNLIGDVQNLQVCHTHPSTVPLTKTLPTAIMHRPIHEFLHPRLLPGRLFHPIPFFRTSKIAIHVAINPLSAQSYPCRLSLLFLRDKCASPYRRGRDGATTTHNASFRRPRPISPSMTNMLRLRLAGRDSILSAPLRGRGHPGGNVTPARAR